MSHHRRYVGVPWLFVLRIERRALPARSPRAPGPFWSAAARRRFRQAARGAKLSSAEGAPTDLPSIATSAAKPRRATHPFLAVILRSAFRDEGPLFDFNFLLASTLRCPPHPTAHAKTQLTSSPKSTARSPSVESRSFLPQSCTISHPDKISPRDSP